MSRNEMVTLDNLGGGAAAEMFAGALEKVIENIVNPNTKPDAVRKIVLTMKVKPGKKDRTLCVVEISCDEKLAAIMPFETAMFVGMQHGVVSASEYAPQQQEMFTGADAVEKNPTGEGAQGDGKIVAIAGAR